MYSMQAVASSLFHIVCFPCNGNIVMIDQTSFKNPSVTASLQASILIVENSQSTTGSVGVGMYPSLMGSFSCPAPVLMIGSSSGEASSLVRSVSFRTTHMDVISGCYSKQKMILVDVIQVFWYPFCFVTLDFYGLFKP